MIICTAPRYNSFVYDYENRLIEANTPDANVTYTYDYLGRRTSKNVDGTVTKYIYDGDQIIAEYDGEGSLLRKYVYGANIDEPVCMIAASGTKYYYHYDGLGNVVSLSDSSHNVVEKYSYDVFGKATILDAEGWIIEQSAYDNPYMFTGRQYDNETGLYYYRARYYDPQLGRFLQTDPIGYDDGLNFYTYCGNNPLNWIDPWGLCKDNINYNDMTTAERAWELTKGFGTGFRHGFQIATNEYTFGLSDRFGWTRGNLLVTHYGAWGRASQTFAGISRDAALAAAVMKASGWNAKGGIHPPHHGQDRHLQFNWWRSGIKGSGGRWSFP